MSALREQKEEPFENPQHLSPSETRRAILQRVESYVCRDRQNAHGDAEDNFQHIADSWTKWLWQRGLLSRSQQLESRDVAWMMVLFKADRASVNLDNQENYDDAAGYAVCGGGINERRQP